MKKYENGFTLMETLIALGVAGVIAAVLVPQLVKNIEKEKAGPTLARTVEQIELGIQNYIQDENDKITDGSYISRISEIDDFSLAKLAPYIGLTKNNTTYDPGNIKEYAYIYDSVFIPTAHAAAGTLTTGVQSAQTDDVYYDLDAGLKAVPDGEANYPDRGDTTPQFYNTTKGGGGGSGTGSTSTSSGGSTPSTPSTPSVTPTLPETPKTPTITPITPTPRPSLPVTPTPEPETPTPSTPSTPSTPTPSTPTPSTPTPSTPIIKPDIIPVIPPSSSSTSSGGSKPSTSSSSTSSSSTSSGGSKPSTSSSSTSSSSTSSGGSKPSTSSSSTSSTSSSGGSTSSTSSSSSSTSSTSSSSTSSSGGSTSSTSSTSSSGGFRPVIPFWPSSSSSSTSSTSSSGGSTSSTSSSSTSSTSSSSSSGGSTSSSGGSTSSTSSSSSSTSSSGGNDTYTSNKSPVDVVFETPLEIGEIRDIVAKSSEADPIIGTFVVDVNGVEHKPNMYGKDTFVFNLRNSGKVSPYGLDKFATACQDGNITDGKACSARVVSDGYKIKY